MSYGVAHTTRLHGCKCFDMQSTEAIENGSLVLKGDLVEGEEQLYNVVKPTADNLKTHRAFLVNQPAWSYDDSLTANHNDENFINDPNTPFRVYELKTDRAFKVSKGMIDNASSIKKGDLVEMAPASNKLKVVTALTEGQVFAGKVVGIEKLGFCYATGQEEIDTTQTMVKIEVTKN